MNQSTKNRRPFVLGILAAIWIVGGIALVLAALGSPSPNTRMAGESSGAAAVFIAAICAATAAKTRRAG
ncbi:MAG: hypothetical protein ACYS47_04685 [Planctomycetota bacterium]|jgi:hypothetical protein